MMVSPFAAQNDGRYARVLETFQHPRRSSSWDVPSCCPGTLLIPIHRTRDVYKAHQRPARGTGGRSSPPIPLPLRQFVGALLHDGHARQRSLLNQGALLEFLRRGDQYAQNLP
jgi:hypothetical protein